MSPDVLLLILLLMKFQYCNSVVDEDIKMEFQINFSAMATVSTRLSPASSVQRLQVVFHDRQILFVLLPTSHIHYSYLRILS